MAEFCLIDCYLMVFIGLWLWVFIRRRMKTLMELLRNPCLRINSNDGENKEGRVMAKMEIIQRRKHRAGGHQLRLRI